MKTIVAIFLLITLPVFHSCGQSISADIKNGDISCLDKILTEEDLADVSKADLRILRNTIFAKYGYKFKSEDLRLHFSEFPWYKGTKDTVDTELSEIDRKNIRVVQKPQFLNNFPEKNREFAAICGKFSRTWERTARFLNKSIELIQRLETQAETAVSVPLQAGLQFMEIEKFTSSNLIKIISMEDFKKFINDNKIQTVFYSDSAFLIENNSILYTIPSKNYRSIYDYDEGEKTGFNDGTAYYYAKETGLKNQGEVDYYRQEQFFSVQDYRDALKTGFVKNTAERKLIGVSGLIRKTDLQKFLRYANAVACLTQDKRNPPDTAFLDNRDIDRLTDYGVHAFGNGYYYLSMGLQNPRGYSRPEEVKDAWFYYAAKLAQYTDIDDFLRTTGSGYYVGVVPAAHTAKYIPYNRLV